MSYNGWSNYETWAVALWLDNDYGSYTYVRELADECGRDKYAFADALESLIDEGAPDVEGMYADLLNAALHEVDYREIAENILAEFPDDESEDE